MMIHDEAMMVCNNKNIKSAGARNLFIHFFSFSSYGLVCYDKQETLMKLMNVCSRTTIYRYAKILAKAGLLFITREKKWQCRNNYIVTPNVINTAKRKTKDFIKTTETDERPISTPYKKKNYPTNNEFYLSPSLKDLKKENLMLESDILLIDNYIKKFFTYNKNNNWLKKEYILRSISSTLKSFRKNKNKIQNPEAWFINGFNNSLKNKCHSTKLEEVEQLIQKAKVETEMDVGSSDDFDLIYDEIIKTFGENQK